MGAVVLKHDAIATEEEILKFLNGNFYFLSEIKMYIFKFFRSSNQQEKIAWWFENFKPYTPHTIWKTAKKTD